MENSNTWKNCDRLTWWSPHLNVQVSLLHVNYQRQYAKTLSHRLQAILLLIDSIVWSQQENPFMTLTLGFLRCSVFTPVLYLHRLLPRLRCALWRCKIVIWFETTLWRAVVLQVITIASWIFCCVSERWLDGVSELSKLQNLPMEFVFWLCKRSSAGYAVLCCAVSRCFMPADDWLDGMGDDL